jgi:arylsulfatase A-like enzyme
MNVLMICVDQWSGRLFGHAGKNDIMTPTIDHLAHNGIRFENCYSECPVCIPARRSLMTGLSPRTHGDRVYNDTLPMPAVTTLAQAFRNAGYQAYSVGKLHVYPQRNRIGFDDALIQEEGRYEFGETDDYQIWLGEHGYAGEEFTHGMGNNIYYTRPWHLPEQFHPAIWTTKKAAEQIKRRDPGRPGFFYVSHQFPHPPLVPVQSYLDMYRDIAIDEPIYGDWLDDSYIMQEITEQGRRYNALEKRLAKAAYYAQCTFIDHQIRILIGTLRECNILKDTLIVFLADHGDMLFDHSMVSKQVFYEGSANIPFILSGYPVCEKRETIDTRLACLADVMPTVLDFCGISIPETVEGISLTGNKSREMLYCEVSEGPKASRMVRDERFKLIYYPYGNVYQLFDMEKDRLEKHNLAASPRHAEKRQHLETFLISHIYGDDLQWIKDGKLVGVTPPEFSKKSDYGLFNQRGYHWPPPKGNYTSIGKNGKIL